VIAVDMQTKVLVIEDDSVLAKLLEYKLVKSGYDVEVALDGEQGLGLAQENNYDLLLLDLMLPRLNGFQLLEQLRNGGKKQLPLFLVLSARSGEEDVLRAFDLGAVDFIPKPFSLDVLMARIRVALSHKRVLHSHSS